MIAMILSATKKTLTIGFYTIAMTFFLFSYHVHEKSILLPLVIAPMLIPYLGPVFVINLILSGTLGMEFMIKIRNVSLAKGRWTVVTILCADCVLCYFYGVIQLDNLLAW
jgi:hypothetical protein